MHVHVMAKRGHCPDTLSQELAGCQTRVYFFPSAMAGS
jgi:hypothetical protein